MKRTMPSGSSNTGEFMQSVLRQTKGVLFLIGHPLPSDQITCLSMRRRTSMSDANMSKERFGGSHY